MESSVGDGQQYANQCSVVQPLERRLIKTRKILYIIYYTPFSAAINKQSMSKENTRLGEVSAQFALVKKSSISMPGPGDNILEQQPKEGTSNAAEY